MSIEQSLRKFAALLATTGAFSCMFAAAPTLARSTAISAPTVHPAVDGIMAAFKSNPLVGIGDEHLLAQEADFYVDVVRDPRFAREVGNVVVEFGGAMHQDTLDRYLAGETVPYAELRKVWTDVVGWAPPPPGLSYLNFFAQVRDVNLTLPPEAHIRVWLGEPPIDWSKIETQDDWKPLVDIRDQYPANLIKREILSKNKKALVIYGWGHLNSFPPMPSPPGGSSPSPYFSLKEWVEQDYPNAFFTVQPYRGFNEISCSEKFEQSKANWPVAVIATPVRGTTLAAALIRPGCSTIPPPNFPPYVTEEQRAILLRKYEEISTGVASDSLLYLGPSETLTQTATAPDLYLDLEYQQEIDRRFKIMTGQAFPSSWWLQRRAAQPYRP